MMMDPLGTNVGPKAYYINSQVLLRFEADDGRPVFPSSEDDSGSASVLPEYAWAPLNSLLGDRFDFSRSGNLVVPLARIDKRTAALIQLQLRTGTGTVAKNLEEIVKIIAASRDRRPELDINNRKIWLTNVSPNWLSGGTGQTIGIGGPATVPRTAAPPIGSRGGFIFGNLMAKLASDSFVAKTGTPVDVFVLDTVPAFLRSHSVGGAPDTGTQPIWAEPSSLDIKDEQQQDIVHGSPPGAGSFMSEHGTFIAGIVKAIAPSARIHLVQVLNDYGIGSAMSMAAGFEAVRLQREALQLTQAPYIINCSFVIAAPVLGDPTTKARIPALSEHKPSDLDNGLQNPTQLLENHELFEAIAGHGLPADPLRMIVAAAGNDSDGSPIPYMARYPARLDNVLGVGAIDAEGNWATFSNVPDNPICDGLMTLGTIRGPFTGSLSSGAQTGFAVWAGTSFAAPVISGLLAMLVSEYALSLADALQLLRDSEPTRVAVPQIPPPPPGGEIVTVTQ